MLWVSSVSPELWVWCCRFWDMIEEWECVPELMFTSHRLAIFVGLVAHRESSLHPDLHWTTMSEVFCSSQNLLHKIRELLWTLGREKLWFLKNSLCTHKDPSVLSLDTMKEIWCAIEIALTGLSYLKTWTTPTPGKLPAYADMLNPPSGGFGIWG